MTVLSSLRFKTCEPHQRGGRVFTFNLGAFDFLSYLLASFSPAFVCCKKSFIHNLSGQTDSLPFKLGQVLLPHCIAGLLNICPTQELGYVLVTFSQSFSSYIHATPTHIPTLTFFLSAYLYLMSCKYRSVSAQLPGQGDYRRGCHARGVE